MWASIMELQDKSPEVPILIEKVGFRDVRRRVKLQTPKGQITLDLSLDLYVEIPSDRRGAHLSRSIEALEVLDVEGRSLEEYLESIASKLLEKHSYAIRASAIAKTTYYVEVEFRGIKSLEPVIVEAEVTRSRDGTRLWSISVEVTGLTVCPSALETTQYYGEKLSHMQRVELKARIHTIGEQARIEKIARALYSSLSAPAITLLKRADEAKLVIEAYRNPKLVEDVVRDATRNIALELVKLRDDTLVEIEAKSYESIHPHNLYAYTKLTLRDAKSILESSHS